jgi:hypothetical protein
MAQVFTHKNFDFSKLAFDSPRTSKNGATTVKILYPNMEEWFFQTPKSLVPFNPYDTNFCITAKEDLEKSINTLESIIIQNAVQNSMSWFNKNLNEEEIREIYISMLSKSKGDWPPFVRVNFTQGAEFYNKDREMVDKEAVVARSQVRIIVKFVKLYIKEKDGKLTMRCNLDLTQVRIAKSDVKPVSYAFVDSDEE